MTSRTLSTLVALVALLALAVPARAQPAPPAPDDTPIAIAKRHFDQAEAYLKAGAFDLAAAEYQAAFDQVPEPALLFNMGLALERHGDLDGAVAKYDRYLSAAPGGVKATEAKARRDVLARKIDERRAEQAARTEAERLERERLEAERRAAAAVADDRPSKVPAIAAYGIGAVSLGVVIVYGLRARSLGNDLEREIATGAPAVDTADPRFDDGHDAAVVADVALGVTVAATLAGVYFTYRVLAAKRSSPRTITVVPSLDRGHAGATFGVRW